MSTCFTSIYYFRATDKLSAFQAIAKELGISCGMDGGYPIALYIARHYHDDFEGGVLCNVNVGGKKLIRSNTFRMHLPATVLATDSAT